MQLLPLPQHFPVLYPFLFSLFLSLSFSNLCPSVVSQAETMKQSFPSAAFLLFFLILVSSSQLSARFIANKQGKEGVELSKITDREDSELMSQLMGLEACDSGDDECLKRRIVSEAHLDYIYTQNHKP